MVRCEACGTENPPDASFCSKCARKLDPETQGAVAVQRAEHTTTGVRWSSVIIAIILLIVLMVLAAFVITHVL